MVEKVYHIGLTVSDLDNSIAFYRDILGLEFQGEILMVGNETDRMFCRSNCKVRVAYLNGSKAVDAPPIELIQFIDSDISKVQSDLFKTSISEICFYTDDIDSVYKKLKENNYRLRKILILVQTGLVKAELFILETQTESYLK